MRSTHAESFKVGTFWRAMTLDYSGYYHAMGETEVEALANLCDVLYEALEGRPEDVEWQP